MNPSKLATISSAGTATLALILASKPFEGGAQVFPAYLSLVLSVCFLLLGYTKRGCK